jgi:hypothetical protein
MLSAWLPWILGLVILIVLPVVLVLFADDHPRSDDPPDSDDGERLPALAAT